jgi:hypothetical protein
VLSLLLLLLHWLGLCANLGLRFLVLVVLAFFAVLASALVRRLCRRLWLWLWLWL